MDRDPTRGFGQKVSIIPRVGSGRVKSSSTISPVGSGRVKSFSNYTGPVGSEPGSGQRRCSNLTGWV